MYLSNNNEIFFLSQKKSSGSEGPRFHLSGWLEIPKEKSDQIKDWKQKVQQSKKWRI